MAIIAVFDAPGMTQAMYEQATNHITGGRGGVRKASDWPVPGLISHAAGPTPNGWLVVDVWESEDAFQRFGEVLMPMPGEIGAPELQPKIYPAFNVVTS
ncbi:MULTISPECIES: hypothetical protein [unclassified Streptomyces]|uniref:hypothetical protein n=1 Tax=unclassified Streptomyces TaxID=2593676 RepID=UPI0037011B83